MKKLFFLLAGVFLLSGSVYSAPLGEKSAAGEPEVVTLTFEFYQGDPGFMYLLKDAGRYNIYVIDMWIHDVDLDKNGYSEYGVTAWIQYQGGPSSEIVPGTLKSTSYVDLSTIQVQSDAPAGCVFEFKFIGIDAR